MPRRLRFALAVLGLALAAVPLLAGPSARVVLALDTSGSMWGQIEGRSKIEIARQVVRELLEDWDGGVHLEVEWTGPDAAGDRIAIVASAASLRDAPHPRWQPLAPVGPAITGPYEVRYLSGSGHTTLLALEITVRASLATLDAPSSVVAGDELLVSWSGLDAADDRDVLVAATEAAPNE